MYPGAEGDNHDEEKLRDKVNTCITQELKERQTQNGTPSNLYGNFSVDDHDLAYADHYNIYINAWYPGTRNVSGRRYADYIAPHEFAFTNILDAEKRRPRPLRNDPFESHFTEEQRSRLWYNNMFSDEQSCDLLFGYTAFCQLRPCIATITQMDDAITRTEDDYDTSPDPSESYTHNYDQADHSDIAAIDAEIRHYQDTYHIDNNAERSAGHEITLERQEGLKEQEPHENVEEEQNVKIGVATVTNRFWAASSDEESS